MPLLTIHTLCIHHTTPRTLAGAYLLYRYGSFNADADTAIDSPSSKLAATNSYAFIKHSSRQLSITDTIIVVLTLTAIDYVGGSQLVSRDARC